jgi:xylulokinase
MTDETVLGLDIGTSSTKAVVARPDGTIVASAERPHALSLPRPGWAEHDAESVWWQDVLALCAELAPFAPSVRGICASGIGPCVVPCDAELRPLRPAILYGIDTRATEEIAELDARYGSEAILTRAGSSLSAQAVGPKLLWLRRHEPEVWARAAGWYMASSFVVGRLTGEYVLDHHSASQCDPLYDLAAAAWAEDWADEVAPGVPLPRLAWPGEQVGTVTAAAARTTGLPGGTPVLAGTIDAWSEAFSAGVRRPGDLMLMYGSTMFFVQVAESAAPTPVLWSTQGIEPGARTLAAGMSTSGSLVDWLRGLFGAPPWDELVAEAAAVPPGSRGLVMLPYFAGERTPIYDPQARGVVAGLTLGHGRAELLRSGYEAVAFGIRQILAVFEDAAGPPARVVPVGGGTRAALWLQIVSDVTGVAQHLPEQTVGASYGDALLAAIGVGLAPPDTDWSHTARLVEPDPEALAVYEELYDVYLQLYPATAAIAHRLGAVEADGASR